MDASDPQPGKRWFPGRVAISVLLGMTMLMTAACSSHAQVNGEYQTTRVIFW